MGRGGIFADVALLCPDGALTTDEFSACFKSQGPGSCAFISSFSKSVDVPCLGYVSGPGALPWPHLE